jgi:hypothetical protein
VWRKQPTVHGNTSDDVLTQMLRNFQHERVAAILGRQGVENGGKLLGVEFDLQCMLVPSL